MAVDIPALRAAQKDGLTVGVVPKDGTQAVRLEIDDLIADEKLANLYFLSLEKFMSEKTYTNAFSYFEISGIHGQPYRAWDKVTSVDFDSPGKANNSSGYCAHGSVIFPTWHRVYLAQFEQALFLHAADIAKQLGEEDVLERFRIPYFDPFLPRQKLSNGFKYGLPIIFTLPQVKVHRPGTKEGSWEMMDNPLYQFDFPQSSRREFQWAQGFGVRHDPAVEQKTIRGYDGTKSTADHSFVMDTFDNNYNPASKLPTPDPGSIWRVLTQNQDWVTMSNHFDPENRRQQNYNMNSLEGFHDDIHTFLGSGPAAMDPDQSAPSGHMSIVPYAAFDPAFWLHHCNVDRLLAIWQGIHANDSDAVSWWTSLENEGSTFVEPNRVQETPTTPLAPFRKSLLDGDGKAVWWNSNDVRDHLALGYDYPETLAARQAGNYSTALLQWANEALGWVTADPAIKDPSKASESDLGHFDEQIGQFVASFPDKLMVDGVTPLPAQALYISSQASPQTGPQVSTMAKVSVSKPAQAPLRHPKIKRALAQSAHDPSFGERFGDLGNLVKDGKMIQWNVTFAVDKFALDGSFMIDFFLGDFAPNAEGPRWLLEPNLAGISAIFASPLARIEGGNCDNCAAQKASGMKYYDTVGLTQALVQYWKTGEQFYGLGVGSLEPDDVVPFLTRNLHWRIVDARGQHQHRDSVPSLKVMVYSERVTLPQRLSDMPVFSDQVIYRSITNGRPGGLNNGEDI